MLILAAAPLFAQSMPAQSNGPVNRQSVPANLIIPQPPPSAPIADWVAARGRTKLVETVPGATLRGWEYKAARANAPVVLFFNGNGMTVDRSDSLYRDIADQGADVCVYDYRGIGFSEGVPDVLTFRQDALRLYDAVAKAHPDAPVVVYGFSLGTAMASYVAAERKVAGLILAGTIATATEEFPVYMRAAGIAAEVAASLAPAPDGIEAFNEMDNITHSTAPLLMLHGEADLLVPINQGREVFANSPATQKKFVSLPGATHNETAGAAESMRAVRAFLSSVAGAK